MHIIIHVDPQTSIALLKIEISNTFSNVAMVVDFVDSFVVRVPDIDTFTGISQLAGVISIEETLDIDKIQ